MDNAMMIGASIIKKELEKNMHLDIKDLARLAFKCVHDERYVWYTTEEEKLFKIGCAALLLVVDDEMKNKITNEIRSLNSVSAAMSGIPVDLGSVLGSCNPEDFVGLLGIYKEAHNGNP